SDPQSRSPALHGGVLRHPQAWPNTSRKIRHRTGSEISAESSITAWEVWITAAGAYKGAFCGSAFGLQRGISTKESSDFSAEPGRQTASSTEFSVACPLKRRCQR